MKKKYKTINLILMDGETLIVKGEDNGKRKFNKKWLDLLTKE
jgi:hypothetical protein